MDGPSVFLRHGTGTSTSNASNDASQRVQGSGPGFRFRVDATPGPLEEANAVGGSVHSGIRGPVQAADHRQPPPPLPHHPYPQQQQVDTIEESQLPLAQGSLDIQPLGGSLYKVNGVLCTLENHRLVPIRLDPQLHMALAASAPARPSHPSSMQQAGTAPSPVSGSGSQHLPSHPTPRTGMPCNGLEEQPPQEQPSALDAPGLRGPQVSAPPSAAAAHREASGSSVPVPAATLSGGSSRASQRPPAIPSPAMLPAHAMPYPAAAAGGPLPQKGADGGSLPQGQFAAAVLQQSGMVPQPRIVSQGQGEAQGGPVASSERTIGRPPTPPSGPPAWVPPPAGAVPLGGAPGAPLYPPWATAAGAWGPMPGGGASGNGHGGGVPAWGHVPAGRRAGQGGAGSRGREAPGAGLESQSGSEAERSRSRRLRGSTERRGGLGGALSPRGTGGSGNKRKSGKGPSARGGKRARYQLVRIGGKKRGARRGERRAAKEGREEQLEGVCSTVPGGEEEAEGAEAGDVEPGEWLGEGEGEGMGEGEAQTGGLQPVQDPSGATEGVQPEEWAALQEGVDGEVAAAEAVLLPLGGDASRRENEERGGSAESIAVASVAEGAGAAAVAEAEGWQLEAPPVAPEAEAAEEQGAVSQQGEAGAGQQAAGWGRAAVRVKEEPAKEAGLALEAPQPSASASSPAASCSSGDQAGYQLTPAEGGAALDGTSTFQQAPAAAEPSLLVPKQEPAEVASSSVFFLQPVEGFSQGLLPGHADDAGAQLHQASDRTAADVVPEAQAWAGAGAPGAGAPGAGAGQAEQCAEEESRGARLWEEEHGGGGAGLLRGQGSAAEDASAPDWVPLAESAEEGPGLEQRESGPSYGGGQGEVEGGGLLAGASGGSGFAQLPSLVPSPGNDEDGGGQAQGEDALGEGWREEEQEEGEYERQVVATGEGEQEEQRGQEDAESEDSGQELKLYGSEEEEDEDMVVDMEVEEDQWWLAAPGGRNAGQQEHGGGEQPTDGYVPESVPSREVGVMVEAAVEGEQGLVGGRNEASKERDSSFNATETAPLVEPTQAAEREEAHGAVQDQRGVVPGSYKEQPAEPAPALPPSSSAEGSGRVSAETTSGAPPAGQGTSEALQEHRQAAAHSAPGSTAGSRGREMQSPGGGEGEGRQRLGENQQQQDLQQGSGQQAQSLVQEEGGIRQQAPQPQGGAAPEGDAAGRGFQFLVPPVQKELSRSGSGRQVVLLPANELPNRKEAEYLQQQQQQQQQQGRRGQGRRGEAAAATAPAKTCKEGRRKLGGGEEGRKGSGAGKWDGIRQWDEDGRHTQQENVEHGNAGHMAASDSVQPSAGRGKEAELRAALVRSLLLAPLQLPQEEEEADTAAGAVQHPQQRQQQQGPADAAQPEAAAAGDRVVQALVLPRETEGAVGGSETSANTGGSTGGQQDVGAERTGRRTAVQPAATAHAPPAAAVQKGEDTGAQQQQEEPASDAGPGAGDPQREAGQPESRSTVPSPTPEAEEERRKGPSTAKPGSTAASKQSSEAAEKAANAARTSGARSDPIRAEKDNRQQQGTSDKQLRAGSAAGKQAKAPVAEPSTGGARGDKRTEKRRAAGVKNPDMQQGSREQNQQRAEDQGQKQARKTAGGTPEPSPLPDRKGGRAAKSVSQQSPRAAADGKEQPAAAATRAPVRATGEQQQQRGSPTSGAPLDAAALVRGVLREFRDAQAGNRGASTPRSTSSLRRGVQEGALCRALYRAQQSEAGPHSFVLDRCVGALPGVEVGALFRSEAELQLVRLHLQPEEGVDWAVRSSRERVATALLLNERRAGDRDEGERVVYRSRGVPDRPEDEGQDHRLTHGNEALFLAYRRKVAVRVIRAREAAREGRGSPQRQGFRYDGLYRVVRVTVRPIGRGVVRWYFQLLRLAGQGPLLREGWERRGGEGVEEGGEGREQRNGEGGEGRTRRRSFELEEGEARDIGDGGRGTGGVDGAAEERAGERAGDVFSRLTIARQDAQGGQGEHRGQGQGSEGPAEGARGEGRHPMAGADFPPPGRGHGSPMQPPAVGLRGALQQRLKVLLAELDACLAQQDPAVRSHGAEQLAALLAQALLLPSPGEVLLLQPDMPGLLPLERECIVRLRQLLDSVRPPAPGPLVPLQSVARAAGFLPHLGPPPPRDGAGLPPPEWVHPQWRVEVEQRQGEQREGPPALGASPMKEHPPVAGFQIKGPFQMVPLGVRGSPAPHPRALVPVVPGGFQQQPGGGFPMPRGPAGPPPHPEFHPNFQPF